MLIKWRDVTSSDLRKVAYVHTGKVLLIEFKTHAIYGYPGVPVRQVRGLLEARESHGKYFNRWIKGGYASWKLFDPALEAPLEQPDLSTLLQASIDYVLKLPHHYVVPVQTVLFANGKHHHIFRVTK